MNSKIKKILLKIKKFKLLMEYIKNLNFYGSKNNRMENIIIIDGPSSVSVAEKIYFESINLNKKNMICCLVPLHYVPPVLKSSFGLDFVAAPTKYQYFMAFVLSIKKFKFRNISFGFKIFSEIIIYLYIRNNRKYIKNLIVFNERGPFACSAITAAKEFNIKICCIQHGAIVDNYFPTNVDMYFTWSDYFSEIIKERSSNVSAVNVGKLDYTMFERKSLNRLKEPLVVLQPGNVSIPFDILLNEYVEVIEICLDVFDGLMLRRHPNDNISEKIISIFDGDKRILFDDESLSDSLSKRKIVISLYSTVLLEAALSDCIPVQYVSDKWFKPIYKRSSIVLKGKDRLKIFLQGIESGENSVVSSFGERIVGLPNYKLLFEKLETI